MTQMRRVRIKGVDLFCGAGGLTKGLQNAGVDVELGVDTDPACRFPYEYNCKTRFLESKVEKLKSREVEVALEGGDFSLMAGCAPCQPFSLYQQKARRKDSRWELLLNFGRLVSAVEPDLVAMENVPRLSKQDVFLRFVRTLERLDYHVNWSVVDCTKYGIPQTRHRLVLVASKLGPVILRPGRRTQRKTVRQTIGSLHPVQRGAGYSADKLHVSSQLSDKNLKRIRASKPGGTWRDWPIRLMADCHRKKTGETYPGVYGRMEWDEPAPTITTQCYGFGNGRFGHPEQDRAISLREAAMLQSFPKEYSFSPAGTRINFNNLGRLIGNAVPVVLGEYIGKTLVEHVRTA